MKLSVVSFEVGVQKLSILLSLKFYITFSHLNMGKAEKKGFEVVM